MTTTHLVDSNVILDIMTNDLHWCSWSMQALSDAGPNIAINPIIYAEISIGFSNITKLDENIRIFKKLPLPYDAAFLAGKAFYQYRKNLGNKTSPLPDFYIGAHAVISGFPLITRDIKRYKSYFPTITLIHP